MATTDKCNCKDSQGVSQHQRMAMGANLNGKTLPGTVPVTKPIPA